MQFDPEPGNPLGWLLLLLIGLAFQMFGIMPADSAAARPEAAAPPAIIGATADAMDGTQTLAVDSFNWVIRESSPPQIDILVSGYWPDGCTAEPQTDITREENTIYVRVTREISPLSFCTQMLQAYSTSVSLTEALMDGGTFAAGSYIIDVNGVQQQADF